MVKTSFKSLEQISEFISEQINQLNNGNLNNSEIEELTENAQELYERLIVLRHKSYETFGEPTATIVEDKIAEVPTEVIEKEIIPEPIIETPTVDEDPIMSFDFSESMPEPEVVKEAPKTETIEEPINEVVEETILAVEDVTSLNDSMSQNTSSLNDTFKSSGSLADRLNNSKIDSLKTTIGINEKFAFISDLFAGSNENYNEAIARLDTCQSADDAKMILNELSIDNNWDLEHPTAMSFIDLVERRF